MSCGQKEISYLAYLSLLQNVGVPIFLLLSMRLWGSGSEIVATRGLRTCCRKSKVNYAYIMPRFGYTLNLRCLLAVIDLLRRGSEEFNADNLSVDTVAQINDEIQG